MVPEFAKVAFDSKPDTVSDVVKTQFGYHIIYVQDRRAAGVTPYEKAKSGIKDYLTTEKQIKALDDLTAAAKKKAKIEYMDERYNPEVIQKKLTKINRTISINRKKDWIVIHFVGAVSTAKNNVDYFYDKDRGLYTRAGFSPLF